MDLFIPGDTAGPLKGDGRDFANPLRDPDLEDTDSRVMVIIDRETGRGVIVQTESCTASIGGHNFCNEARPISINGDLGLIENDSENDATGEGINLDVTNNYNVHPDGDGVRIDYESRNSVSPFPAISGDITLQPGDDGALSITDDDRDQFPAYATYQYRPGEPDRRIEHRDAGSPIQLITPPDLPDLPEPSGPARAAAGPPGPAEPPAAAAPAQPAEPARSPGSARPPGPAGPAAGPPEPAQSAGPAGMRGMKNTMLARIATAAALAAALGGCGETDEPAQKREAPRAPTVTPAPGAGSFPAKPQVVDKFDDDGSGWPRDGYRDGAFVLPADGSAAVLAPKRIEPATRGTLSEVIAEPARGGAAGLLCRASADGGTGYALLLDSKSTVQLLRLEDGKVKVLKQHKLTPNERSDPGKPSLLRLGCGTGKPGQP